jgi:hypothetical protein
MSAASGLFFWKKKKETQAEKVKEMLEVITDNLPKFRGLLHAIQGATPNAFIGMDAGSAINPPDSDGTVIGKLYDFYQTYFLGIPQAIASPRGDEKDPPDQRLPVTPKSVVAELEGPVVTLSLEGLDEKIKCLQDKTKLTTQHFTTEQINGMIERLEFRRQYPGHQEFFGRFPYTTDEKIDLLVTKYKLKVCSSDLFIPTLPKEAVDVMGEYSRITKEITSKAPVFYLIGEESDFKKKYEKLDPILLVQSPFGFVWQILGAWDKEMMLLSEL